MHPRKRVNFTDYEKADIFCYKFAKVILIWYNTKILKINNDRGSVCKKHIADSVLVPYLNFGSAVISRRALRENAMNLAKRVCESLDNKEK